MAGENHPPLSVDSLMVLYVSQLSVIAAKLSKLIVNNIGLLNDHLEQVQDIYERVDRRKIYLAWCANFPRLQSHPDLIKFVRTLNQQNEEDLQEISRRINVQVERTLLVTQRLRDLQARRKKLMCRK